MDRLFFCVNIGIETIDKLAEHFLYYYPYIYDWNLPNSMKARYPTFTKLVGGQKKSGYHSFKFASSGGKELTAIGKSSDTNSDLYEDYVSPILNTPLLIETWCGGTFGNQCSSSYCKGKKIVDPSSPQKNQTVYGYDVALINEMSFGSGLVFPTSYNHGKWAIAYEKKAITVKHWFCNGDINHMTSQRRRGGGAACMIDETIWSTIKKSIIVSYDKACE